MSDIVRQVLQRLTDQIGQHEKLYQEVVDHLRECSVGELPHQFFQAVEGLQPQSLLPIVREVLACLPEEPIADLHQRPCYEQMFVRGAQAMQTYGQVEVDSDARVGDSDGEGEYVQAWLWVPNSEVVFRRRFDLSVEYTNGEGDRHSLGRVSVMAFDRESARKMALAELWDSRLDAAGCRPQLTEHPVHLWQYTLHVLEQGPYADTAQRREDLKIPAASEEDALLVAGDLYPGNLFKFELSMVDDIVEFDQTCDAGEVVPTFKVTD